MGEMIATRNAYGAALCEFGDNPDVVVFEADLSFVTMSGVFGQKFPERYFNVGIAEANMIDMAAGFAACGKIAVCHSLAMFAAGRGYDQIRNSVAYPNLNVKIVGSHAGVTIGEDGATHQCLEDLSLMRTIPGMVVLSPCDANETREAVKAMIDYKGPCFMRTGRSAVENITPNYLDYSFRLGKGVELVKGSDITIIATGLMVQNAVEAAALLTPLGISARVIDMHTIKPIDKDIILKAATETGAIVTAEEHNVIGGLGSAVCEVVCETKLVPVTRVGVQDCFGCSGDADGLLVKFGLTPADIVKAVQRTIKMKP